MIKFIIGNMVSSSHITVSLHSRNTVPIHSIRKYSAAKYWSSDLPSYVIAATQAASDKTSSGPTENGSGDLHDAKRAKIETSEQPNGSLDHVETGLLSLPKLRNPRERLMQPHFNAEQSLRKSILACLWQSFPEHSFCCSFCLPAADDAPAGLQEGQSLEQHVEKQVPIAIEAPQTNSQSAGEQKTPAGTDLSDTNPFWANMGGHTCSPSHNVLQHSCSIFPLYCIITQMEFGFLQSAKELAGVCNS